MAPDSGIVIARNDSLQCLKDETRALHYKLDHETMLAGLLDENLTKIAYSKCLALLADFYRATDESIWPWLRNVADLEMQVRLKSQYIEADLAFLGVVHVPPIKSMRWQNAAQAWGALYVVEGATLGGARISKQLQKKDWFEGVIGRRHFAAYGADTGLMWTAFRTCYMQAAAGDPTFTNNAVFAAREVFHALHAHLTQNASTSSVHQFLAMRAQ